MVALAEDLEIRIPNSDGPLAAYDGRELVLGIRPEHLRIVSGTAQLTAVVEFTEQLGSELHVSATRRGSTVVISRVDPDAGVESGDRLPLVVDPASVHFFDPVSEQRIG